MSNYLKPQTPIELNNNYIYPLTTVDQVITGNGERLNSLFKKTIKENVTLNAANWSNTKPYTQTITLTYSVDDYDVDANIAYGDNDNTALYAAAGCLSYIKKNHKKITFYCLKSKPNIDIPIEITGTCRNTIATIEDGIKLNFDVVGGTTKPSNPKENTIWVNTNIEISSWMFSITEPTEPTDNMVWIYIDKYSQTGFNALKENGIQICPSNAKQYVSGTWVDVDAISYQNGEWVDWFVYLFYDGNQYEDLTGGWIKSSGSTQAQATVTVGNTIIISSNFTSSAVIACTKNKIDLTDYSAVIVKVSSIVPYNPSYPPTMRVQIHNSMNYDDYSAEVFFTEPGEYLIPLDGISSGYPSITVYCATIEVSEIKLVR